MSYSVQYSTREASWYVTDNDKRVSDLYDTDHAAYAELARITAAAGGDVVILEGVEW